MTVYFDSSALVSVYVTEAYSERTRRKLRKRGPVPWTPLHDLEVRNALRLLHGRRQIDEAELEGLLGHIDDDRQRGRLARTLDVLHVAALIEIRCETLVSGDERQITLARAEGLRTFDIRAST